MSDSSASLPLPPTRSHGEQKDSMLISINSSVNAVGDIAAKFNAEVAVRR